MSRVNRVAIFAFSLRFALFVVLALELGTFPNTGATAGRSLFLNVRYPTASSGYSQIEISGTPPSSDVANQRYIFTPSVSGGRQRQRRFHITNRPAWAGFSATSGTLSGTPTSSQEGTSSGIQISVTDGITTASLPTFSISVIGPTSSSSSTPPTISGTPPTSATAGSTYAFEPVAADPDGDALSFSVQGKPTWASFSIATGMLSGTPASAQIGTYSGIVISVSDGTSSAELPAFSITVTSPPSAPPPSSGSATLSWTAPTENTDGSPLTTLAGYEIDYGTSATNLSSAIDVAGSASTYTITNLSSGTWYFGIKAYTSTGSDSALSSIVSKSIP